MIMRIVKVALEMSGNCELGWGYGDEGARTSDLFRKDGGKNFELFILFLLAHPLLHNSFQ